MLSKKVIQELNHQVGNQFGLNHFYTVVSMYFAQEGYHFLSKYFRKRAKAKMKTGKAMADYVERHGGEITLHLEYEKKYLRDMVYSLTDIFEKALSFEEKIGAGLSRVYDYAMLDKDAETAEMIDKYLAKSRNDHKKMGLTLQRLREYDEEKHFIYMEGINPRLSRSMAPYLRESAPTPLPMTWMMIPKRS